MTTKKTATKTKNSNKSTANKNTSKNKKQDGAIKSYLKKHKEFSKVITGSVLLYAIWFTDRVLDVMVEFQVFESLDTLITHVCYMGIVALGAYAFRQRSKDKVELESMNRNNINQEKKVYGDDYILEKLDLSDNIYPNM